MPYYALSNCSNFPPCYQVRKMPSEIVDPMAHEELRSNSIAIYGPYNSFTAARNKAVKMLSSDLDELRYNMQRLRQLKARDFESS